MDENADGFWDVEDGDREVEGVSRGFDGDQYQYPASTTREVDIDHRPSTTREMDFDHRPSATTREMDLNDKPADSSRAIGLGLSEMPATAPVSLGRQDSETIPKSVKDGLPTGSSKKRREQREKSPEPVQRAFSFPDDIADEEAFTAKDVKKEDKHHTTRSIEHDQPVRGIPRVSSISDFMRSVSNLPPVQEELSDEEPARHSGSSHKHAHLLGAAAVTAAVAAASTPKRDSHRDSGFGSDSPHVSRQLPRHDHDHDLEGHRDSGVHLRDSRDWPDNDRDRVLKKSPLADTKGSAVRFGGPETPRTPRLREPSPPPRTPEPEKLAVKKRTVGKQDTPVTGGASAHRSISDNYSHVSQSHRSYQSPRSTDPTPRRVASNTSISRLRTPEPLGLRPVSPASSLRSYTGTPPLRRVDKRVSGDLRAVSLSQQDLGHQNKETDVAGAALMGAGLVAAAGAAALLASNNNSDDKTTPVANEGRVRAKDMADVFVCFYSHTSIECNQFTDTFSRNRTATARAASAHLAHRPDRTACAAARACKSSSSNRASPNSPKKTGYYPNRAPRPRPPSATAILPSSPTATPRSRLSSACSRRPTR